MQSMAKLHSYYVTNASTEMSYAHIDLTDFEFYKAVNESFGEFADFSDDEIQDQENELNRIESENDDNALSENNSEIPEIGNEMIMENYFNFDNEEFQRALEMNVRVVIEQEVTNYDHGKNDYDINSLLDANLNKDGKGQNEK